MLLVDHGDNHDTPATFHRRCDPHSITVVFTRNSIGYVFGGYVRFCLDFLPLFAIVFC